MPNNLTLASCQSSYVYEKIMGCLLANIFLANILVKITTTKHTHRDKTHESLW